MIYLLKTIVCSGIFYLFYFLLLRKERMLVFNRIYLPAALVLSLLIPLMTFTINMPSGPGVFPQFVHLPEMQATTPDTWYENLTRTLSAVILLVSMLLLLRLCRNVYKLLQLIKTKPKVYWQDLPVLLVDTPCLPHSLGNCIMVNRSDFESGKIADSILLHEKAHIRQKHFYDLLFIELIQVFWWFNPVVLLFKKAIRLNHEYLADATVVDKTRDTLSYQQLLLQNVYVNHHIPLASSFYFFTIKNRLLMLQKKTKPVSAVARGMLSTALLVVLIFVFSERIYAQTAPAPPPPPSPPQPPRVEKTIRPDIAGLSVNTNNGVKTVKLVYKDGTIITADVSTKEKETAFEETYGVRLPPPPPGIDFVKPGPGATDREMKEYEAIVAEMATVAEKGGEVDGQKTARVFPIYEKMTLAQREKASPLPPPPPPAPPKN